MTPIKCVTGIPTALHTERTVNLPQVSGWFNISSTAKKLSQSKSNTAIAVVMTTKLHSGNPHCTQADSGTPNCNQAEKQLTSNLQSDTLNCKIAICFSDRLIAIWSSIRNQISARNCFPDSNGLQL